MGEENSFLWNGRGIERRPKQEGMLNFAILSKVKTDCCRFQRKTKSRLQEFAVIKMNGESKFYLYALLLCAELCEGEQQQLFSFKPPTTIGRIYHTEFF